MKDYTRIIYIAAPLFLVLALVLWNWDWTPKTAPSPMEKQAPAPPPRAGMTSFSSLETPGSASDAGPTPDGPFAGLTFRCISDNPEAHLKFHPTYTGAPEGLQSDIEAFTFMEADRVGAIVQRVVVLGSYTVLGDGVTITLRDGNQVKEYNLVHNSAEEALLGPNVERYDLRGGKGEQDSFTRAKKRSTATKVVNDARIYEAAIDQWAIEHNKVNTDTFAFSNVSDYIKASSELVRTSGKDVLGNPYRIGTVVEGVRVSPASYQQLTDVTRPDFWSSYAPR